MSTARGTLVAGGITQTKAYTYLEVRLAVVVVRVSAVVAANSRV